MTTVTLEEELDALKNGASLELVLKRRVERGVEFFNHQIPKWRSRVEIKRFDIRNECRCVVGQVFDIDPFEDPNEVVERDLDAEALVAHATWSGNLYATECGFDYDPKLEAYGGATMSEQYEILQELWEKELSR